MKLDDAKLPSECNWNILVLYTILRISYEHIYVWCGRECANINTNCSKVHGNDIIDDIALFTLFILLTMKNHSEVQDLLPTSNYLILIMTPSHILDIFFNSLNFYKKIKISRYKVESTA